MANIDLFRVTLLVDGYTLSFVRSRKGEIVMSGSDGWVPESSYKEGKQVAAALYAIGERVIGRVKASHEREESRVQLKLTVKK